MTVTALDVVHAYEAPQNPDAPRLFLAGPTPRSATVRTWRPDALALVAELWTTGPLTVLNPEPREAFSDDYTDQYEWEHEHLEAAGVIAFWVPRDVAGGMPAFTTNIEWGRYCTSGRTVLGTPPDAERVRYMQHQADRYGVPRHTTLRDTLTAAIERLRSR